MWEVRVGGREVGSSVGREGRKEAGRRGKGLGVHVGF